ncbi:MAG: arylesterase [Pseudolabrys sp.]|nr:arylesterase [Pseudolabrys sp.]MSP31286.1 arylesterase [Pseudolabrys sp.]
MWFHRSPPRSYGTKPVRVQRLARLVQITMFCVTMWCGLAAAADGPVKIVVLGDSLSAGFGLPAEAAFPERLTQALKAKGIAVAITNAGVSGDTASGGLGRLDWSVPDGTEAVILELGANDALRGLDQNLTKTALDTILNKLKDRHIAVLLAGMQAPRNMGADYVRSFDAIFPALASTHAVVFYPFFLEGVAADPNLNQRDGLHPNAAGVDVIVARILPKVEELIARVRAKK